MRYRILSDANLECRSDLEEILKNAMKDSIELEKVIDSDEDEYKELVREAAEPMRLTLVPKEYEDATFAFLSLNILIRQENYYRSLLEHRHIVNPEKKLIYAEWKGKPRNGENSSGYWKRNAKLCGRTR